MVARVCLDMLRSRKSRKEQSLEEQLLEAPDNLLGRKPISQTQALLADSVGSALLIVLRMLAPAERVAFVLHDLFDLPFEEIGPIVQADPKPPLANSPAARVAGVRGGQEESGRRSEEAGNRRCLCGRLPWR